MDLSKIRIGENLVPRNYLNIAQNALKSKEVNARELIEKRKIPVTGWPDESIEELIHRIAELDSNNFPSKIGLGEREARIACKLVARRHYNFGHGIGRSGDLLAAQPKAAGSTLLANLTNELLLDLMHEMGIKSCRKCVLVPMATGMTLNLCLLALKKQRPMAKYVLWSRIDQKSCFKSMTSAGLVPIIIDQKTDEQGCMHTDMHAFERKFEELKREEILCIFSTTSCFAPRNSDSIMELAKLALRVNVPHLINNAYGLQSTYLTHQLEQASRSGRIDLFVQSTDKNLLVPVGGAIIGAFDEKLLKEVGKTYAGRASSSQSLDVLMTLLSLGRVGYRKYVNERKVNFDHLRHKLQEFAETHSEIVLNSRDNPISLALTLKSGSGATRENITQFGSKLYTRGISGVRVMAEGEDIEIDGYSIINWGTHSRNPRHSPYLTVSASLGVTLTEIENFFKKLYSCWHAT